VIDVVVGGQRVLDLAQRNVHAPEIREQLSHAAGPAEVDDDP
jgi:hypothetical protein